MMSPQNDPKYLTAPLLSPPFSLVQPNSGSGLPTTANNITGTPPKLREVAKIYGSASKGGDYLRN
jgi:hypothetical protein